MKRSTLAVLALTVGFALACGGGDKTETTTTTTPPPPPPPAPIAAPAGTIGVPECDDYIKKMEACLATMDPAAKPAVESSFKQTRESWTQAAATPEGKAGLAQGCKAALETMPANCVSGAAATPKTEEKAEEKAEEKTEETKAAPRAIDPNRGPIRGGATRGGAARDRDGGGTRDRDREGSSGSGGGATRR